jgi:hypothetical protein
MVSARLTADRFQTDAMPRTFEFKMSEILPIRWKLVPSRISQAIPEFSL